MNPPFVADGELVVVNSTMSGRHTAPIAMHTEEGKIDAVIPPTGESFDHPIALVPNERRQDRRTLANRDDLGLAKQLGWIPPMPAHLVRMALANGGYSEWLLDTDPRWSRAAHLRARHRAGNHCRFRPAEPTTSPTRQSSTWPVASSPSGIRVRSPETSGYRGRCDHH